jgi:hypothetical protein
MLKDWPENDDVDSYRVVAEPWWYDNEHGDICIIYHFQKSDHKWRFTTVEQILKRRPRQEGLKQSQATQ